MFGLHSSRFAPAAAAVMAVTLSLSMSAPARAATAGRVEFATSGVSAVDAAGQSRALARGAEIGTGDTIATGAGRAQLRFSDGGMISLQPQTRFRLDSYAYDKDASAGNSVLMNLLEGGLRSITGLIGKTNRQGYKLQTATATVGIRGTEFSVNQFPDGSILFNCADGTIDVTNAAGSAVISGGQSARVASSSSAPQKTDEKPFLPPGAASSTGIAAPPDPVNDANQHAPLLTGSFTGEWRITANGGNIFSASPPPTFIVGADGTLVSFSDGGTPTVLGAAKAVSDGNDGVMAWGRWIGGPAPGVGYSSGNSFPANDPLHYVVGLPATNVPASGIVTYNSYGSTQASCSGGGSCGAGAVNTRASVSLDLATLNGTYSLTASNSSDGLTVSTSGTVSRSINSISFSGTSSSVSGAYGGSTSGSSVVDGFLAGPGGSNAGLVYKLTYLSGPSQNTTIAGGLVLRR